MKLFDAIRNVSIDDTDMIERITDCIDERISWMEDREPESSGEVYDAWSEKYDDLSEIKDLLDQILTPGTEDAADLLYEAVADIETFHAVHGGLSRLKV